MSEPIEITAFVRGHTIPGYRTRTRGKAGKGEGIGPTPEKPRVALPWRAMPQGQARWPDPDTLPWPDIAVVFGTVGSADISGRLLFGSYRVLRGGPGSSRLVEEGLFLADDLSDEDERAVHDYASAQGLCLRTRRDFLKHTLFYWGHRLHHRTADGTRHMRGAIVGWDLPVSLSRLAFEATPAARARIFRGGWTLDLLDYDGKDGQVHRDVYTPSVSVKNLSSGTIFGLTRPKNGKRGRRDASDAIPEGSIDDIERPAYTFRGHFLDTKTLARALTGESTLTLEAACSRFGVAYQAAPGGPAACVADVRATGELYQRLLDEYSGWHLAGKPPSKVYSSAGLGKAVLKGMGITQAPPTEPGPDLSARETPESLAGYARAAFYAGRMEVGIRLKAVPVVPLDAHSMYGNVAYLLGLWRFIAAGVIVAEDATAEVVSLLSEITPARLTCPGSWRDLNVLCLVEPDGDLLPIRTQEDGIIGTTLMEVSAGSIPMWYALPDVIASRLKTGRAPRIIRAIRAQPVGQSPILEPVEFHGISLDPARDDLFEVALSARAELLSRADPESRRTASALKIVLSSVGYGIWGEEHTIEPRPQDVGVDSPETGAHKVRIYCGSLNPTLGTAPRASVKGDYYSPIIASLVTAGARLMLALMESAIEEAGGCVANAVIDGLDIVATETGSLIPCGGGPLVTEDGKPAIRALSWAAVDSLRKSFAPLSPFGEGFIAVEKFALDESGNHRPVLFYGVSTLRYCLFGEDGEMLKGSAHVLGGYAPPRTDDGQPVGAGWIDEAWQHILSQHRVLDLTALPQGGLPEPTWLDTVAFVQRRITHPSLTQRLEGFNAGRSYLEGAKPFGSYLEVARPLSLDPDPVQDGTDLDRMGNGLVVIQPAEDGPATWLCWDTKVGAVVRLVTPGESGEAEQDGPVEQQRWYRRMLAWIEAHPEIDPPAEVDGITWRRILDGYGSHPEAKSLAPDGSKCERGTSGVLRRKTVRVVDTQPVGRVRSSLKAASRPDTQQEAAALVWLRSLPRAEIERQFGYSTAMAKYILAGDRQPSASRMPAIVAAHRGCGCMGASE